MVPLIGGMTIGAERAFGCPPSAIYSYEPFYEHDRHLRVYYSIKRGLKIPYYAVDDVKPSDVDSFDRHDVVHSVCPCAGLSMLSQSYGTNNPNNEWLYKAAEFVLGALNPAVYYGENAPNLVGKIGTDVRNRLIDIGRAFGYSMSFYRTKALRHGVSQVRDRSYYFYWRSNRVPVLMEFEQSHDKISDVILNQGSIGSQQEVINKSKPSDDPFYAYFLDQVMGGITHRDYYDYNQTAGANGNSRDVQTLIEKAEHDYLRVAAWMDLKGFDKQADKCRRTHEKLKTGNIMKRGVTVPYDYIGAFVGHYPMMLTHPIEDRFITYREALAIMGMPSDFELQEPLNKNKNHICQNVCPRVAEDIANEVKFALMGVRRLVEPVLYQTNGLGISDKALCIEKSKSTLEEFVV
jgi:site-specific DNA-cytosine methylase